MAATAASGSFNLLGDLPKNSALIVAPVTVGSKE